MLAFTKPSRVPTHSLETGTSACWTVETSTGMGPMAAAAGCEWLQPARSTAAKAANVVRRMGARRVDCSPSGLVRLIQYLAGHAERDGFKSYRFHGANRDAKFCVCKSWLAEELRVFRHIFLRLQRDRRWN